MITREGNGLVRVTGTAAIYCGMWVKCKARSNHICKLSGKAIIPGDEIYRPITNSVQRGHRVLAAKMEFYL